MLISLQSLKQDAQWALVNADVGIAAIFLVVPLRCATADGAAEARVRLQLGPAAEGALGPHRDTVILPLADRLLRAKNRDGSGAVQAAGNAFEAHIDAMAGRMTVPLGTATGIISKLSKFAAPPRHLPAKLIQVGTYLGAIRNAADHGTDADINNTAWQIRDNTALEYIYVACSFIAATIGIERGDPAEI